MFNSKGQTLIGVLIAVGILGAMAMAMASMFAYQNRENESLREQLASNDLARSITFILSQGPSCNQLFQKPGNVINPSSLTFNKNGPFPTILLKAVPLAGSTDVVSLSNPMASSLSNTLKIQTANGIQVQVLSATAAKVVINFNQTGLVRSVPNLSFLISLVTTGSGSNVTITGCQSASATPTVQNFYVMRFHTSNGSPWGCSVPNPATSACTCAPGTTAAYTGETGFGYFWSPWDAYFEMTVCR